VTTLPPTQHQREQSETTWPRSCSSMTNSGWLLWVFLCRLSLPTDNQLRPSSMRWSGLESLLLHVSLSRRAVPHRRWSPRSISVSISQRAVPHRRHSSFSVNESIGSQLCRTRVTVSLSRRAVPHRQWPVRHSASSPFLRLWVRSPLPPCRIHGGTTSSYMW